MVATGIMPAQPRVINPLCHIIRLVRLLTRHIIAL
jgi:hypothetical protein